MKKQIVSDNAVSLSSQQLELVSGGAHCTTGDQYQQVGCEIGHHATEAVKFVGAKLEAAYDAVASIF
jgi:hypothetical protein